MKIYITASLILIYCTSYGQGYINTIIESEYYPLVNRIYNYENDKYIIPYVYGPWDSTYTSFIITDFSYNHEIIYKDIKMGVEPLIQQGTSYYHVGENAFDGTHILTCKKYNKQLDSVIWKNEYPIEGFRSNSSGFVTLNNNLFMLNTTKVTEEPYQWLLHLTKIDTNGNLLWLKEYGSQARYNVAHSFFVTLDNNLIISQITSYSQPNLGDTRLIKLTENGEIIWEKESIEKLESGSVQIHAIELSDSNIVQMYEVEKFLDPIFSQNQWNRLPTKLKWLNSQGDSIKEKLLIITKKDRLILHQMETGKGDYFYTYGSLEIDTDNLYDYTYGIIMKFDNNGDTIWVHRYKHPDYVDERASHNIVDILEQDNGDIVVLGDIRGRTDLMSNDWYTKIWVMRLDENGCFGEEECEEFVTGTDTVELDTISKRDPFVLYPNPTTGIVQFDEKWQEEISSVIIYDCLGNEIYINQSIVNNEIDVTGNPSGIYFVKINLKNNKNFTLRIVKTL